MKKVLVLYYSQTGQLTSIARQVTQALQHDPQIDLTFVALNPVKPWPFPWTVREFLDVFPESLLEVPCSLQPLEAIEQQSFDLVILACQVWYLSPSIPVSSFLQSAAARRVLNQRPVITLIGCRNMWLLAHTKIQAHIQACGGRPVGNIVLEDRTSNLLGVVTIVYWMLSGKKKRLAGLLPLPGIDPQDIQAAERFGPCIREALLQESYADLQTELRRLGAVTVQPAHILFERRLHRIFKVWAKFIRRRGGPGEARRRNRLRLFGGYLVFAIVIFAPLAQIVSHLLQRSQKERLHHLAEFFSGLQPPESLSTQPARSEP